MTIDEIIIIVQVYLCRLVGRLIHDFRQSQI